MNLTLVQPTKEISVNEKISEKTRNTTNYKSFHYLEDSSVHFSILSTKYTTKVLDSGVYNLYATSGEGGWKANLEVATDKETFSQDISFYFQDKIGKIYEQFFNSNVKEKVNELGYNHKLGILLYGKHGTGKTSMLKKYFNNAVNKHNGIVFNVSSYECFNILWKFIQEIRKVQNNPIVIFMDEIDELVDQQGRYNDEGLMKKILDGFESIDNCLFMMATNYIERIPKTIKDRPSRVKYCIEVEGIQDERVIAKFLKDSFDRVEMVHDFSLDIKNMKGNTLDELKQYILDVIMKIEPNTIITKVKSIGFN